MKKRVEQLLNGIFEYELLPLALSEEKIEHTAKPGQLLHGTFTASHPEQKKVKGFLYSSNPRVSFEPVEFYGMENRINYQIDTSGLQPGEVTEGVFTLCTDLGEYTLPYLVHILPQEQTAVSPVNGTEELAALAEKEFQEAYPIFISPEFEMLLEEREPEYLTLYRGLKVQPFSYQSMEEFLIGCDEKDPVEISIDRSSADYKNLHRSIREILTIRKNGWGFLCIEVSSDSHFIRLDKKTITTDEFAGNQFDLEYIIDTNFLHAGKNYGRIKIDTCYQSLYLDILVIREVENEEKRQRRIQKMMQKKLEALYIDFRLKKIDMQTWIDRSANVIGSYKRAGGRDVFADLFQVQLLFADEKRAKGYKLLQEIEQHPGRMNTPERYGFYLYISTFFQREASYVDQVEARIEQMFLQNRESWVLQWILLYLQERLLRDDSAKLEAIAEQVRYGCSSPIMYLEAVQILKKDPFLLRRLGGFELKVLSFAARQNLLTEELAHQVGNLALYGSREFSPRLFDILQACYQVSRSAELIRAICTILIAGDKKEPEYFYWYSLGVNQELRITGLYEYYMETMDQRGIEKMPQIIRMYFVYNNTLDYHKRAHIYRSISDNRDNVPQVYRSYRGAIEQFLTDQLSMGRIDENLALLYERYLTKQDLNRAQAERLVKCLFTFEITCKNPNMKSVVVTHRRRKGEQVVHLTEGKAQVQIYTEDARILLMDGQGNRYASTSLYMAERLLDTPRLLEWCKELVPENPGLVLYVCGTKAPGEKITEETLPFFKRACDLDVLEDSYRGQIRKWLMDYYRENPRSEDLFLYLKQISYPEFLRADKETLMTLLTQEGMYEEAFSLLDIYGCEQVPLQVLVRICSQTVLVREYEENPLLVAYCSQCFSFGKYDDNILTYLLMYYDGPIEEMKRLWNIGRQYDLDTMTLEEKILSLLLFTRTGTGATEQIFASYQRKLGRKKICGAYLNLKAYEYFVKDMPVHDLIFTYLEHSFENKQEQEDVCKLALLRHYSRQVELTEQQTENARLLLAEYNGRGLRFAFYQKLPPQLLLPYQLEDKVFLEYAANPESTVLLHYRKNGQEEYLEEPMKNCFEGINVKEFILFYGEEVECFAEEIRPDQSVKTSDHRFLRGKAQIGSENSRFELINRISKAQQEQDAERVREELETYCQLDHLTREIFTLI